MTVLNQADAIYLGDQAVDAVFLGAERVWPKEAPPPNPYIAAVLADNPMGFWPLDDTTGAAARDLAGTNPGQYVGGITLAAGTNPDGTPAVRLDGASGTSIPIPTLTTLPAPPISFEIWINMEAGNSFYGLITKTVGTTGRPYDWWQAIAAAGNFIIATTLTTTVAPHPSAGQWFHFVATYSGAQVVIYRNGTQNTAAGRGAGVDSTNPLRIGNRDGGDTPFRGLLARAAVYDYVLSPQQVADHYAAAQP